MAIAKIKKLEIIGLQEDKDRLLALLQKLGMVELIDIQETAPAGAYQEASSEINLLEIEETITYLASFQERAGFLEGMVQLKPLVYDQQLKEVISGFDYQGLLHELSDARNHLKVLTQHAEKLHQEKQLLGPWVNLTIPLEGLHATKNCGILLGILRTSDYANLLKNYQETKLNLFCESVNQHKTNTYLAILYLQEEFERLEIVLKNHHFSFVTLSRHKGLVKDRLLEINRERLVLDDQVQEAKNKIIALSREQFKLMVVYDYLSNIKNRQDIDKKLAKQQFTFCLQAWMKMRDVKLLEKAVASEFKNNIAMFVAEPGADENYPVDLENKPIIRPFEFITKIYGMPQGNELDPTPFLAPFFFLYFGFCMSDVGYGLILVFICWFALAKFKLGPQGLRFFRLFLLCGISTIIIGALTGSWFGNLLDMLGESNKFFLPLKNFKDSLVLLDPLKQPTKLLSIALCLGIAQVWFGHIVAAIGNIKNKRYLNIIFDQVTMLTFLFGLTGLGLIFLGLWNKNHLNLFKCAAVLGAVALIFTQGRSEKGLVAKLFYGAYNLYNAFSGYLSDILSYSRLWALGLVTSVMANTINLISLQFSQILVTTMPFLNRVSFIKILVGGLVLIVIFIFGHIVSFSMNLLGAFIHPVRLQFVEFFSKFFKAGGRSFKPFKTETKYINIS
jgi:V/A-type H+-transporting ATPase subunit I